MRLGTQKVPTKQSAATAKRGRRHVKEFDFSGKTALVVGGSSGIGNAIAQAFRAQGAETHIWGTRPSADDYDAAKGSHLAGLRYAQLDMADIDALEAYAPPFAALDVLVLSQGIGSAPREDFGRSRWDQVMNVNIDSVMACARKFHPMLKQTAGSIIIVSSVAGFVSNKHAPAYAASKAAAVSLTKSLGEAWARDGVRVNGLAPGYVVTKMTQAAVDDETISQAMLRAIPQRRFADPSEMTGAALFLASPFASYICGHTLVADGGMTLSP